jgi:hypothetical protein
MSCAKLAIMLTHLVCFKYKADTPESARDDHRAQLRGLKDKRFEGLIDLTVGADVVGSPRSYDTGLVVTFRDRAALDAYQTHADHVSVAQYGRALSEHIVAVDYLN